MDEHAGQLVRRRIKELGWTGSELGRRLGARPNHVSQLLSGRTLMSFDYLVRLADLLGIDRVDLVVARMEQTPSMRIPIPVDRDARREIAELVVEGWFKPGRAEGG